MSNNRRYMPRIYIKLKPLSLVCSSLNTYHMIPLTRIQYLNKITKMNSYWSHVVSHYAEANYISEIFSLFTHLISLRVIREETKIDALIANDNVKRLILRVVLKLTKNGIIAARTAIAECLRVHPHFECERCISHIEKRWSIDRHRLTHRSIQPKARAGSIITR